jgi:predicted MFS family arabinose efflux permease
MKKPNIFYKVLITSFTLSTFSEGIILPIYAIFVQKIGGTILDAGYAMGIFLITTGIFTTLVHRTTWSSRTRIFLMLLGWLIWLIGIGLYLLVSNIAMLFLAQIFTAIGNAVADPVFEVELADHTDPELKEYEWGLFDGSKDVVDGAAAILGALIVSAFGFRIMIYTMVFTATISFLMILWYVTKLRRVHLRKLIFNQA